MPEKIMGCITSEEDAITKGKTVLIDYYGQEHIDKLAADYTYIDGEQVKLIRDYPPIMTKYHEETDFWLVYTVAPSGKTEDGKRTIVTPGSSPSVIIRGVDGKVFGVL